LKVLAYRDPSLKQNIWSGCIGDEWPSI